MYSGHVAGAVYERLELPQRYIILCPNHTGAGHPLALMKDGAWRTPLGDAPIDRKLADLLLAAFPLLNVDSYAHRAEHALEVQLPFLQVLDSDFQFVPIVIGTARLDVLTALGESIAKALEDPLGLYEVVHQRDISMCGYGPAVAMLIAARRLGASGAELIKYATSGDISGDRDMVVGYAGVAVL
jgi:predicted class III extradiol MEMO1 family dioxygenase